MTDFSLLMTDDMMAAALEGRKTQTRRPMKPQPEATWRYCDGRWYEHKGYPVGHTLVPCYGEPGDTLWLREAWQLVRECGEGEDEWLEEWPKGRPLPDSLPAGWTLCYRATGDWEPDPEDRGFSWRPSIHMPRWACRATFQIVRVRAERVQDITEADAMAEGMLNEPDGSGVMVKGSHAITRFATLWDKLYAADGRGWVRNPWVWVIEWDKAKGAT